MTGSPQWDDSFSVGIEQIDAQHKKLFGFIADLSESVTNPDVKQRWSAIHYTIVQLREYTHVHFSVEECLLDIFGFPGQDGHVKEHVRFIGFLEDLERRSIMHNDISENEIVEFLREWLISHIAVSDKEYGNYVAKTINAIKRSIA